MLKARQRRRKEPQSAKATRGRRSGVEWRGRPRGDPRAAGGVGVGRGVSEWKSLLRAKRPFSFSCGQPLPTPWSSLTAKSGNKTGRCGLPARSGRWISAAHFTNVNLALSPSSPELSPSGLGHRETRASLACQDRDPIPPPECRSPSVGGSPVCCYYTAKAAKRRNLAESCPVGVLPFVG